jgi:hypothetical protein
MARVQRTAWRRRQPEGQLEHPVGLGSVLVGSVDIGDVFGCAGRMCSTIQRVGVRIRRVALQMHRTMIIEVRGVDHVTWVSSQ